MWREGAERRGNPVGDTRRPLAKTCAKLAKDFYDNRALIEERLAAAKATLEADDQETPDEDFDKFDPEELAKYIIGDDDIQMFMRQYDRFQKGFEVASDDGFVIFS
ncbi:MAG: hypothetical protein U9Q03_05680 [Patescibacteria group bacterium]|nr:hypothetical protein [Patescibacteria group bacterium]